MSIRNHSLVIAAAVVFMYLAPMSSILAQYRSDTDTSETFWFNIGLGGNSGGLSWGTSVSFDFDYGLISMRYIYNGEITFLGPSPDESAWDFGLLYGTAVKTSYGSASISGGIAFVGGLRRGRYLGSTGWFSPQYDTIIFSTIGFPIEGQLFWTPFSSLSIGIYGFANLNRERSFAGVLLCIQF